MRHDVRRTRTVLGPPVIPLKREIHMFPYTPRRSTLMADFVRMLYGR